LKIVFLIHFLFIRWVYKSEIVYNLGKVVMATGEIEKSGESEEFFDQLWFDIWRLF
jgi:hypothetical protein